MSTEVCVAVWLARLRFLFIFIASWHKLVEAEFLTNTRAYVALVWILSSFPIYHTLPMFTNISTLTFIGIAIDISIVISSVAESVATTIFISVIFWIKVVR